MTVTYAEIMTALAKGVTDGSEDRGSMGLLIIEFMVLMQTREEL